MKLLPQEVDANVKTAGNSFLEALKEIESREKKSQYFSVVTAIRTDRADLRDYSMSSLTIVMYHYVRPITGLESPGITTEVAPANLEQLDRLTLPRFDTNDFPQ